MFRAAYGGLAKPVAKRFYNSRMKNKFDEHDLSMITKDMVERYERVRSGGAYNMFDPRARQLVGVSEPVYAKIIFNYSDLMKKFDVKRVD
jgi:hypothetical protein